MTCEHDQKRYGLFGLPKEANGCLACAYEQAVVHMAEAMAVCRKARDYIIENAPLHDPAPLALVAALTAVGHGPPFIHTEETKDGKRAWIE